MKTTKHKHLRLEDRIAIETYLGYGIQVSKIAPRIGKERFSSLLTHIKFFRFFLNRL